MSYIFLEDIYIYIVYLGDYNSYTESILNSRIMFYKKIMFYSLWYLVPHTQYILGPYLTSIELM